MSKEYIESHWSKSEPIKLRGKTYRIGRMSYGDYFLEEKKDWNKGESDLHSEDTLWLQKEIISGKWDLNYIV